MQSWDWVVHEKCKKKQLMQDAIWLQGRKVIIDTLKHHKKFRGKAVAVLKGIISKCRDKGKKRHL